MSVSSVCGDVVSYFYLRGLLENERCDLEEDFGVDGSEQQWRYNITAPLVFVFLDLETALGVSLVDLPSHVFLTR